MPLAEKRSTTERTAVFRCPQIHAHPAIAARPEECDTDKRLCALGDLAVEAGKDFTGDEESPPATSTPGKLGKKKHR